jgi:NAD(P)H dehydrogenase (quinone)
MKPKVLIIYHSRHGSVAAMANKIAIGAQSAGAEVFVRTVSSAGDAATNEHPAHPVVSKDELLAAQAIITGCPVRFGQMSSQLKQFWEQTSDLWLQGALIDKIGGVFTASASLHGGQEANLLGMMLPMLHHGMLIAGQPYDAPELLQTKTGGTPYGPSHVSGAQQSTVLTPEEQRLCLTYGKRLAMLAAKLL